MLVAIYSRNQQSTAIFIATLCIKLLMWDLRDAITWRGGGGGAPMERYYVKTSMMNFVC